MLNRLKNIFKFGIKSATGSTKRVIVEFQGKAQPALLYLPYGMFSNPADGLLTGLLADQSNEDSLMAMVTDTENREELEEKEVAFGVPSLQARIFFRENGDITFKIGDQEGGDFAVRFTALETAVNNLVTSINTAIAGGITGHTHVSSAPGSPSGPGVGSAPSVTSDLSGAKIDEIKFPS